jgi:hypothetical protein
MRKVLFYSILLLLVVASSCKKDNSSNPDTAPRTDSLVSGAGYANDIYYSLANGVVKITPRNNWDLAFSTPFRTASIFINSGNGDSLFLWNGGTIADFNTASGLIYSGNKSTNLDDTSWFNNSAFEQGMNLSNPYDAGWGLYNINTHDVDGDSVYILKLSDGSYKKIAILNKLGSDHSYTFVIANLESGAPIDTVKIETSAYTARNFVYYAVSNKQIIYDREPENTTWDFVFTRYDCRIAFYPIVSGILTNEGVSSAKLSGADTTKAFNQVSYTKKLTGIGFDWKYFNNNTYTYDIVNPYYFVKTLNNHYYKIKFESFDYTAGRTNFVKTLVK